MRHRMLSLVVGGLAMLLAACSGSSPMRSAEEMGWNHYGFARDAGPTVALGAVRGGESNVVVEGTITEVCAQKGCWMRVRDGGDELFVRFQDYAFFVPMNAAGHKVVMHGTALAQEVSVEELRHYAADANASPAEIAAITEPQPRVTFFADSVYIEGPNLDPPHVQ